MRTELADLAAHSFSLEPRAGVLEYTIMSEQGYIDNHTNPSFP